MGEFSIFIKDKDQEGNDWWLKATYGQNKTIDMVSFWKKLEGLYDLYTPR